MRILLDTHVFIWATTDDILLSPKARNLILAASEVYVSAVSIWEIAIKSSLGKIAADAEEMLQAITTNGFRELPVRSAHAAQVAKLPLPTDHKDPFDRLLVAQSLSEPLILLTADVKLARYGSTVRVV